MANDVIDMDEMLGGRNDLLRSRSFLKRLRKASTKSRGVAKRARKRGLSYATGSRRGIPKAGTYRHRAAMKEWGATRRTERLRNLEKMATDPKYRKSRRGRSLFKAGDPDIPY